MFVAVVSAVEAANPLPAGQQIPVQVVQFFSIQEGLPLKMPTDVAVDHDGRLYVTDGVNHRVVLFAPKGEMIQSLTGFGGVTFIRPLCVNVDAQQGVWISDSGAHEVYQLDPNLAGGQTIQPPPGLDGDPADPADLAVTPDGRQLYLLDNDHHRLLIYAKQAGLWESLGNKGQSLGQFEWPFMMACNDEGYLFITEAVGARVQQLSPQRRWAGQIGGWGVKPGQFYRPKGIAIDRQDRVYVGDSTSGVIQVFRATGRLQGILTDEEGLPIKFAHPMGLCFDENGFLYIVEMMNHRIVKVAIP